MAVTLSARTGRQDETILYQGRMSRNLKILWKVKLDNAPRQMHSLLPVLIADQVPTTNGPKRDRD